MVYEPIYPIIEESAFKQKDWTSSEFVHVQGKEGTNPNMPQTQVLGFIMMGKVDADHAFDTAMRRSRMGFIMYLNCAPLYWISKNQPSVESSLFGSELIATNQCCKYL